MALSEDDLLRLLHSTEHTFAERKTVGDHKDWIKTIVGFANSLDPTEEGVLFIGATDSGQIEAKGTNFDTLQKTFSEKMVSVYPPVYHESRIVREQDRECLAVIVPGSRSKPHFAGPLFVRKLSETVVGTSEQYDSLLAARTDKAYELQLWRGSQITIREVRRIPSAAYEVREYLMTATIMECNQFYLTVKLNNKAYSYPLASFELSYDQSKERLQIEREVPNIVAGHSHDLRG